MKNTTKIDELKTQINSNKSLSLLLIFLAVFGTLLTIPMAQNSMAHTQGTLQFYELLTLILPSALPLATSTVLSVYSIVLRVQIYKLENSASIQPFETLNQTTSELGLLKNNESLLNLETVINMLAKRDEEKKHNTDTPSMLNR